jgi:hypothetical protein
VGERVWVGAPEPRPSVALKARTLRKVLLPALDAGEATHWARLMDDARELAAKHETRIRVIIDQDKYGLPWALINTDPTAPRP